MKTNKNSKTHIGAEHLSQSELTGSSTKTRKKYRATLHFTQYSVANVIIEAVSLAEAEKEADEIESDEIDDWTPVEGDFCVDSVEPVEGGQDNE